MFSVQKVLIASLALIVSGVAAQNASSIITSLSALPQCALLGVTNAAATTPCVTLYVKLLLFLLPLFFFSILIRLSYYYFT